MRYEHLISQALATPWAIEPAYADRIADLLVRRVIAGTVDQAEIQAAINSRREDDDPAARVADGVAVIQLYGPIVPKGGMFVKSSGASSAENFASLFESLCANADVNAIVIDADSPGGSTNGITEAYARMTAAKRASGKTVAAVSNYMMCSAAYYLCSMADEIIASPSSYTGAIGVFAIHESVARKLEAEGIDVTVISAGDEKVDGIPVEPLSERAATSMQSRIDALYSAFVRDVAAGRNTTASAVRSGYGRGAPLTSGAALDAGVVDRVGTLSETVDRMRRPQARAASRRRRASTEDLSADLARQIGEQYVRSRNS